MIKELFASKESNEVKIVKLKKYMETGPFLEVYFFPQEFLECFIPFAVQVLNNTEPEKKAPFTVGRNEVRYTIFRTLNKFSLKSVHNVELVYVLNKALQVDNLPNVILALKALNSLSRSKVMTGEMADLHVNVLLSVIHDLFGNIESIDENLIEMSLFAFIEVLSHACAFFHRLNYYVVKIDQFLIRVYGYIRRILENRRFLDLVLHKKVISIEVCSAISKLLKLTYEHIPVIPKMSPYYMFVSEVALIAVFYCPPDPAELRKEICFFVTKVCVSNKEAFLPVIDKIYTLPFLFSPDTPLMNIKGLSVLSEILGYFKESLTKVAYLDFGFRASEILLSLCYSAKRFCNGLNRESHNCSRDDEEIEKESGGRSSVINGEVESIEFYIESIKIAIAAVENMCRCFGSRSVEFLELHDFYLRNFYDLSHGFRSIEELSSFVKEDEKKMFKELVVTFISGFKEIMGRIGTLEKSGANIVILSTPEIHILYSIFEGSFDIFCMDYLSQESVIEEFFSVLLLIREHIANDIIKHCSGKILEHTRRKESFFGLWKAMMDSIILGNAIITHILPRITGSLENENLEFVRKAMTHIVPFFANDVKKIRKANTFFMHKLISTLMTSQPKNIYYFEILLEIFNIFGSMPEKSSFFQKYIFDNFVKIVEHLMKLYESQDKKIFIEMIFALPISINLVETDIQFLIKPIEKALKLDGGIKTRALSILVYVLDFSTPDKVVGPVETLWKSILKSVLDGLKDSSTSLLCARILGKVKTYQRALIGSESLKEEKSSLSLIRLLLDGKHKIPAHSLFLEAVQNIRGSFQTEECRFDSEHSIIKFRRLGVRCTSQETLACSFRFLTDAVYYLVGWGFFREDSISKSGRTFLDEFETLENIIETADYVYSTHSLISFLCNRKCSESRIIAQYIYDAILALFSCYDTALKKEAQQLLHSIFGTVMLCKIFSFFRVKNQGHRIFLDIDTFFDALIESFADSKNPLPFKTLSVLFIQAYELLGPRSEDFCVEVYRTIFSKLETMCKSSGLRRRNAGINGIMCLVASIPVRELVLLKIPEDAFSCIYLYLAPQKSGDFSAPLRLALFILRLRYRSMRSYLISEGTEEYITMPHFTPFVLGLFDNNKYTVEFSRIVLSEIVQNYAPGLLKKHGEAIFKFLKQDYVMNNKAVMIRHLQVFVFCVREGNPFSESEMKYLIGKFLDNISNNEEWKGFDGTQGGVDAKGKEGVMETEKLCSCRVSANDADGGVEENRDDKNLVVQLEDGCKRLSSLSVKDLIELGLRDTIDILCDECKEKVYRHIDIHSMHFANESEELIYWMKEFYLIVVEYSKLEEEIGAAVLFMFKHISNGCLNHLSKAYELNGVQTKRIMVREIEVSLSGKVDYRLLTSLLCIYSRFDIPEDPRVNLLVSKILREFKTSKEFAIIAQDSKYSMLAKAYELAILLKEQDTLCSEIMDAYIMLDAYVRSYTSYIYPQMLKYVNRFSIPFMNYVFKKIQEPSIYSLCGRLYSDSPALKEIVGATKVKFAERITQSFHGLGENSNVDMSVFVYAYKFLELAEYEMKPTDIQAVLGVYSDLRSKSKDSTDIKNLLINCINRFSAENFEALFKLDPLFVAVNGIDPTCFTGNLSPSSLKNMLRSIDRTDTSGFDRLVDSFGDSCYLLIELFVETGVRSNKLLKYCKETLQNVNLRSLLLYYLCTFEPLYVYFEVLFKMPYEDRKYTLYCLEKVVDSFEPTVFEELILIVLRSEVRFKTNLHILFPLFSSRPALISKKIAYELIGSIYKLLNFFVYSQQKIAAELFSILYDRFPVGQDTNTMGSDYDAAMTNIYTFLFINFIHLKIDCSGEIFRKYDLKLNLNALTYSSDNINLNNMLEFLEVELCSGKDEEYKRSLLNNVISLISPHFSLRPLSGTVVRYLVDGLLWNYGLIPAQFKEGTIRYNRDLLYNLLCVLCDDVKNLVEGDAEEVEIGNDKLNDMLVCSSIIKYLFNEYNKGEGKEVLFKYIEDGLERIFYILSMYSKAEDVVHDIISLYIESLKNTSLDVSPLMDRMAFLVSDQRTTLAEKIELILLLDGKKCDEDLICEISLPVFVKYRHSGVSAMSNLQKFFMQGLCSSNPVLRNAYFDVLDSSIPMNKYARFIHLLDMSWKHNNNVGYAIVRIMISAYHTLEVVADRYYKSASDAGFEYPWALQKTAVRGAVDRHNGLKLISSFFEDIDVYKFKAMTSDLFDILYHFGTSLLPVLSEVIRVTVGEFDEQQCRDVFKSFIKFSGEIMDNEELLGAFLRGLEPIYGNVDLSELIKEFRGGDAWFVLLEYATDKQKIEIFRQLMDSDSFFGMSRAVCSFPETMQAYFLQQVGKTKEAQVLYENTQEKAAERRISFNDKEYEEWQNEWIRCAKELQQWDVCYSLGIHKGDCSLSLEAVWHLSDFTNQTDMGNFRSLLNLREEGFEKEFYSLFLNLFTEYSPEKIGRCLSESIIQLKSYPISSGVGAKLLLYLQVIIEMVESDPIFNNKIDTTEALTSILFRWKDKEPLARDSFGQWSLFSTWRRHVYSRLGTFEKTFVGDFIHGSPGRGYSEDVLNPMSRGRSSPLPHLLSPKEMIENSLRIKKDVTVKGVNEMARVLNAFAGAAIDRGYYDVALFNLKDIFDLSSIKVADAFQKVVYELLCLLEKKEYRLGMDQCGSTNIQHFSDAQSSVLFNFKGLFSEKLGKFAEAEKLYMQSVQICNVVGDNWLTWATYLFNKEQEGVGSKEETFLTLTQAITHCTGEKARKGILKLILLMRRYHSLCDTETFQKIIHEIDISKFIYFIPQLIALLETKNADLVQVILVGISKEYFQAVVNPLRMARERLRKKLCPKEEDYNSCMARMKRLKMDMSKSRTKTSKCVPDTEQPSESKIFLLENIIGVYNLIKDKSFGKDFERIIQHIHNTFNSHIFKEEELIYLQIEKIFNHAVSHVIHRKAISSSEHVGLLNELISHLSPSSLNRSLKDMLMNSIFGMEFLCPLENIDDMVSFKHRLRKIVEGSFYKMNKSEDSGINLMLHRSMYKHEIFGQYSEIRSSYKNMVRIEMFEPRWSYIYKKKIGYNRIHLRGSDGKLYRYEMRELLKTAPSEFIFPQLSLMINEAMRSNSGLSKRGAELKLFVPVAISEALVVECVRESVHGVDNILEEAMQKHNISIDQCVLLYLNQFANIYEMNEDASSLLKCRYNIENGVERAMGARMGLNPGECPNIRHKKANRREDETNGDFVEASKAMTSRQREKYVGNLRSKKSSCLGCDDKHGSCTNCIMPCTYKYEISQRQRHAAYEKISNTFCMDGYIRDYFKSLYGDLSGYFRFKRKALLTYATNTAFLYSFFIVDRRPENLVFTRNSGCFMNRRVFYEGNGVLAVGSKAAMAMISPAYQSLFGKEGIEGLMLSAMYHYGEMLDEGDWYRDLLKVMLEESSGPILGERFEDISEKMLARILYMREKNENGTYNVIPLVSEWMDTFKLAQVDPRNLSWF